ncbi:predicted protein [Lichtheimia corymbifera JMRC:FSU:9682]|uniref:Uncharacterized protein n=1 Tax=Lichtheimia corymbifera JMRC:FSU:9682 TaxID=1263082 RepID=A0A068SAK6_9FUNG|nr:predicted protein [Lichtheimia corymbifera JMRC:FSU:9682]
MLALTKKALLQRLCPQIVIDDVDDDGDGANDDTPDDSDNDDEDSGGDRDRDGGDGARERDRDGGDGNGDGDDDCEYSTVADDDAGDEVIGEG